jgi:hypothetical protein
MGTGVDAVEGVAVGTGGKGLGLGFGLGVDFAPGTTLGLGLETLGFFDVAPDLGAASRRRASKSNGRATWIERFMAKMESRKQQTIWVRQMKEQSLLFYDNGTLSQP